MIRLDKFISVNSKFTRSQTKKIISSGQVSVNASVIKNAALKLHNMDEVLCCGEKITALKKRYFMLNKPKGYICSTQDEVYPSILNFLDVPMLNTLRIVGRLDVDTTGLVLITDDGQWLHKITSPKMHCNTTYQVELTEPAKNEYVSIFKKGVVLKNEAKATLPAELVIINENTVSITLQQGMYHQVKRMFVSVGNHVKLLHRKSIGKIVLDAKLDYGQWRSLTDEEITLVNK